MPRFSATLMDHFQAPRNQGRLENSDVIGISGVPGRGRFLVLYLKVDHSTITEAAFECQGCGVSIACGSALTELLVGRAVSDCRALAPTNLIDALDGIPPDKQDRAAFALVAWEDALRQLDIRQPLSAQPAAASTLPL